MLKKILLALLCLVVLASTANANVMVTDINVSKDINGAGFVTTDTNIVFTLWDDNTQIMSGVDYNVSIYYGTYKGEAGTAIVTDLNLGDVNAGTGYCKDSPPAVYNSVAAGVHCEYPLLAATINALPDANFWIDINVRAFQASALTPLYDVNMDSNYSFFIDNNVPVCSIDQKRGNDFEWNVTWEGSSEAVGSTTTIYYAIDNKQNDNPEYSTSEGSLFEDKYEFGEKKYWCYVTDSAGNTSDVVTKTIDYGTDGSVTITSGGAAQVVSQATAGISGAFEFATANPIFALIVVGVAIMLFSGSKKKRKRKG